MKTFNEMRKVVEDYNRKIQKEKMRRYSCYFMLVAILLCIGIDIYQWKIPLYDWILIPIVLFIAIGYLIASWNKPAKLQEEKEVEIKKYVFEFLDKRIPKEHYISITEMEPFSISDEIFPLTIYARANYKRIYLSLKGECVELKIVTEGKITFSFRINKS